MKKRILVFMMMMMLTGCGGKAGVAENDVNNNAAAETTEAYVPKSLAEGDKAPDFTVQLASGDTITLSHYKDKVVLLNFWATWCGPCVNEMPAFEKLENDNMDDVLILCVDCMEDKSTVDQFIKENGFTFNIGYDEKGDIEALYPTNGIPYTLVIYKGYVTKIFLGALDADYQYGEYKNAIEGCFKE